MVKKLHKGFTLVELLIVIVIIGILAAVLLLSSGSSSDSAQAARIISNLRGLKAAALMAYADSSDHWKANPANFPSPNQLIWYMDRDVLTLPGHISTYITATDGLNNEWWVHIYMDEQTPGTKAKMAAKAASLGFYRTIPAIPANLYNSEGRLWYRLK